MSIHSVQFIHFSSCISIHVFQFIRFNLLMSIHSCHSFGSSHSFQFIHFNQFIRQLLDFNSFMSIHSLQVIHVNSFISIHSCQVVDSNSSISIHSFCSSSSIHSFQFVHVNWFRSKHSFHAFHFNSRLSNSPWIPFSHVSFSKFPPRHVPGTTWYCIRSSKHSFSCRLHSSTPFHSDHTALKAFRSQLSLAWFSCHTKGVLAETGWASKVWVLQTMSRFKIDASDDRIEQDKKTWSHGSRQEKQLRNAVPRDKHHPLLIHFQAQNNHSLQLQSRCDLQHFGCIRFCSNILGSGWDLESNTPGPPCLRAFWQRSLILIGPPASRTCPSFRTSSAFVSARQNFWTTEI